MVDDEGKEVEKSIEAARNDETSHSVTSSGRLLTSGPHISTRGVPAGETMWLPPHDSPAIRAFEDKNENSTRNAWGLNEVVQFIFPARYQPVYHQVALAFLQKMTEQTRMEGAEIADFVASQNISKATFYNRVLPRLRRVGMIKIERQTVIALESKRKYRPMTIHLSKTFGNYLVKIGDSWLAAVDEARSKYDQQKKLDHFEDKK